MDFLSKIVPAKESFPQGLTPTSIAIQSGTAEAVPFQND
jgi:hypothetical protein